MGCQCTGPRSPRDSKCSLPTNTSPSPSRWSNLEVLAPIRRFLGQQFTVPMRVRRDRPRCRPARGQHDRVAVSARNVRRGLRGDHNRSTPRCELEAASAAACTIESFCAQLQSMSSLLRKGLKELLAACGLRLPADLATSTGFTVTGVAVKPGEASEAPGARAIRRRLVINSRPQSTVDPVVSPCVFVPFCCVSSSGRGPALRKERV